MGKPAGRPRVVRTEQEQRLRRTTSTAEAGIGAQAAGGCQSRFRAGRRFGAVGPSRALTPEEEQRGREERRRQQKREWACRRREHTTGDDRAANAKRMRVARRDPEYREAQNVSRRRGPNASNLNRFSGATARFQREFVYVSLFNLNYHHIQLRWSSTFTKQNRTDFFQAKFAKYLLPGGGQ